MHLVSKKNMLHAMHYKEAHWSFRSMATPSDSVLLSTGVALPSEMTEMWRRGELTDARLIVAGQAFDCHRLVLAAKTPHISTYDSQLPHTKSLRTRQDRSTWKSWTLR